MYGIALKMETREGKTMIRLFTDSDLDGLGCGIAAKLAYGDEIEVSYCTYRNLDRRVDGFLNNPERKEYGLYITDLSVNSDVQKKLDARAKGGKMVQMIDHHVTALPFNNYSWGFVKPTYDSGKKTCAASLFYEFLVEKGDLEKSKTLEQFIELIRQYDTWEWEENENLDAKRLNDLFSILGREKFEEKMFNRLKRQEDFSLEDAENFLLDIEEEKIDRYIRSKNRRKIQTFINDYCVGIVHAEQYHSELGNELNKKNPHLDLIAIINVGNKSIGFRTIHDEVDVSEFAKTFGGGGHPKASGCSLTEDTFKKFVIDVFGEESPIPDPDKNEYNLPNAEYGTWFENRKGELFYVYQNNNGSWKVRHKSKNLDEEFNSYEEAERYIKRNFVAWLQFDNNLFKYLTSTLGKNENELKAKFSQVMKDNFQEAQK